MEPRKPSSLVASRTEVSYSGPLPPSEQLAGYEAILPGLADRVVTMAEGNAAHRQRLEAAVVHGNVRAQHQGQWFAFILSLVVVGVGSWLVVEGRTSVGLWLILGDVVVLAGVFITGRVIQKRERSERRSQLEEARRS